MRYDAFISYRHSELDMEIAKKLHKGLETFKIPASVSKKYGKKRIERVFRDQEELPIGSDLDDNITSALAESEFLIVVCSPRTPGSVWVRKEIETFIKLHDRNHVLAILIEGEPNESFPSELLVDDEGRPVEPLAADVRGETAKERDKRFKTELMRLVAPLVGCEYDDLKQRHRERIIRRNLFIASMALLTTTGLGIAFGLYNAVVARDMEELANKNADLALEKTVLAGEIFVQLQETQKNQSRFYAERSLSLLAEGKREAAALIAMEGLPGEGDDERPYVPENEYALSQALHVYDDGSRLDHDRLLGHEQIVKDIRSCADGKYLVSIDRNENVYVWDTETWERIVMIPGHISDDDYLESVEDAFADEKAVYITTSNTFTAYDLTGKELYHITSDSYYTDAAYCKDKNTVVLIGDEAINIADLSSGKLILTAEDTSGASFSSKGSYMGEGVYAVAHMAKTDTRTCISVVNTQTGERKETEIRYDHILKTAGSDKGYVAVLSCNPDFYMGAGVQNLGLELIDREGNILWSRDLDIKILNAATFSTQLKIQDYNDKIVFAVENGAYIYDVADGTETSRIGLFGEVNSMLLSTNSGYGCVGYSTGVMDWIDTDKGVVIDSARIDSGIGLMDMYFFGNQRVIRAWSSSDVFVLSYHKGKDIEELPELETRNLAEAVSPDGGYYVMTDYMDGKTHYFYDPKGNLLYAFDKSSHYAIDMYCRDDLALIATSDGIWEINPFKASAVLTDYRTMGGDGVYTRGWFSDNGKYCVLWTGRTLTAFDTENKSAICTEEAEEVIGCAVITGDGSKIYLSQNGKNLAEIRTDNGAKREYTDATLRETANSNGTLYLTVSPSGSMAAMFCSDGKMRIIDTKDEKLIATIPIQIKSSSFIKFDEKEKHLLMQGDDHTIYIWDIANGEYSCIIEGDSDLKYVIVSDKNDKVICCDGAGINVLDAGTFVRIAYIPDGVAYISSEDAFIQKDGTDIYKCSYMNYKELIDEAKRQFPDAKLGAKEKKEYNIE